MNYPLTATNSDTCNCGDCKFVRYNFEDDTYTYLYYRSCQCVALRLTVDEVQMIVSEDPEERKKFYELFKQTLKHGYVNKENSRRF